MKKNRQLSLFDAPAPPPLPPQPVYPRQDKMRDDDMLEPEIPDHMKDPARNFCYRHYNYEAGVKPYEVTYERAVAHTRMCERGALELKEMDHRIKEVKVWIPQVTW